MSILHNMPTKLIEICGVTVTLSRDSGGEWYIDFNTGMKSHLHLYYVNGKYIAKGRYDVEKEIETFEDFHNTLVDCMCGRDFMNLNWLTIYNEGFGEFTWDKIVKEEL